MSHRTHTASLLTALILVAANGMALAGSGAGRATGTSTVLQDSAEAFEVQTVLPDGQVRSVSCQRLGSDPLQEEWNVSLTAGTGAGFNAWLIASSDNVVITGFVEDTPFLYTARLVATDVVAETRRFGDSHFSGEFNLANRVDVRNTRWAAQFRRFTTAASRQPAWGVISDLSPNLSEILSNSSYPGSVGRVAKIATGAIGASPAPMSLGSYVECLKTVCRVDGGCWGSGGCRACSGDSFPARVFEFIAYTIDAEICFFQEIVNPFRNPGVKSDY